MQQGADTTPSVLALAATAHPHRKFVVAEDGTATYGELSGHAAALAAEFSRQGLARGDRVGLLLANGRRWLTGYFASHAAGAAVVPLNTWDRKDDLLDVVRRSRMRILVAQGEIFGHDVGSEIESVLAELPAEARPTVVWWEPEDDLPLGLDPLDSSVAVAQLAASESEPDDEALLVFTSGSTAHPKAVPLVQKGLVTQGRAIGDRQGVNETDRFWIATPLFFVFACGNAVPNALTHGATLCVQERFAPESALAFIEQHRCTVYYGVGPMARALAACPDLSRRDISSLRKGTANATEDDLRITIDVLGVSDVCNAYGMTEAYGHTTVTDMTDPAELRMRSQGTVLPTQEFRIVDEAGSSVGPDVLGEIQLRGLITRGYLDDDELNRASFDAEGWFRTGDLGKVDADGVLTYRGRQSETMKINGINISPAEVEELLVAHPDVAEAFVFAVPTPEGEDAVACAIVPRAGAVSGQLPDVVRAWAKSRVAKYKVPTKYAVMAHDSLPLTATGKVSKRLIRESQPW
jgi:fatty-acyl-CoA synthase